MEKELSSNFNYARESARELTAKHKWGALNSRVLNRFGEPIIEAFVQEEEWEKLKRYNQQYYNGFRVFFSSIRNWNPENESSYT